MSTSMSYLQYVLEQLSDLEDISYRQMMGEYIIYYKGKIAAYVCDDRLLLKPVKSAVEMVREEVYEPPYEGAKPMLLADADDKELLQSIFEKMYDELPFPKPKANKTKKT